MHFAILAGSRRLVHRVTFDASIRRMKFRLNHSLQIAYRLNQIAGVQVSLAFSPLVSRSAASP
jgi:hypothetical protein